MKQNKLNKAQQQIVNHMEGACLVTACAGGGKTFSLINRTKELVKKGVLQNQITIVTFTKNSASDLIEKLKKENIENIRVGTFHSICSRILFANGLATGVSFDIRDYEVDNIWVKINKGEKTDCEDIRSFISYQKAYNIRVDDEFIKKETNYDSYFLRQCYREYEEYKRRKKVMDFDDILIYAYDLFERHKNDHVMDEYKTEYLMVDEHQDSNLIQNMLIPHLCSTDNIMCIGDVRQTLYSFRGSTPQQFLDFTKTYPNAKVIDMNINYRSCSNIIERVNTFAHNWYVGELFSDTVASIEEKGKIIRKRVATDEVEAKYIVEQIKSLIDTGVTPKDICVLYRLNSMSSLIEMMLQQEGIEYSIDSEGSFFKVKEIRAVLCMLRLAHDSNDNMAYEEVFSTRIGLFKFLPNALLDSIRTYSALQDCTYLEASEHISTPKPFQKQRLLDFARTINNLKKQVANHVPLKLTIDSCISSLDIEHDIEINPKYDEEKRVSRKNCLKALKTFIRTSDLNSFLSLVYKNSVSSKKEKSKDSVQLMTVHKSKGLEWNNVFFMGHGESFPNANAPIEEEANIFYVGTTRAKRNLWVTEVGEGSVFVEQFCQR